VKHLSGIIGVALAIGACSAGLVAVDAWQSKRHSAHEMSSDTGLAIGFGCWLRSCPAVQEAGDYGRVHHEIFAAERSTWWIWDKPDEGRLMIGPNAWRALGVAFWAGLTLSPDTGIKPGDYDRTVRRFLTPRNCVVDSRRRIDVQHWEFRYRC
jgi:hypothetical protein